jgi:formylglycine-generating enzyme required for sulfatase activity
VVSWCPVGWEPEDANNLVEDHPGGHRYYRRLVRQVGGQKVVAVVVPQKVSTDPRTFYALENKVCNDLYAAFMADREAADRLLRKYSQRPGCEGLVRGDWRKGGAAPNLSRDNPAKGRSFGVDGPEGGHLPVFRVTVTEAHCFAEWLDGRLPKRQQWRKAAGRDDDARPGPFDGALDDKRGLAIDLRDGPWPVERGDRDVSIHGCRQMASNGHEWTRDLDDNTEVPLAQMLLPRRVWVQGQSYLSRTPLTFKDMDEPEVRDCTAADSDVGFRIVLEQQ